MKTFTIKMMWDDGYWFSRVNENAGFSLTLESNSYDTLVERVKIAIQDILEVDFSYTGDFKCIFQSERIENMQAKAS
ncbi:MAG: DUF1902 domain-containing protein [Defluviitaleaceae bacterium]|nr:DUF1902 domain-containing protein [Defluviitaleaceae bacterium]